MPDSVFIYFLYSPLQTVIMDKILEGLVSSDHSVLVKRAIVKKVVEAAEKEVTEEQCRALFTLTTRLILLGEDTFQKQIGFQVLEAYARYHRPEFESFFSKDFVLSLLQQGYGQLSNRDPAIIEHIHCCLRLLISCPSVLEIFSMIQVEVLRMVCERPEPTVCARLSTLLSDFVQCIPRDKSGVMFCQQLVRTISYFHCFSTQERELREYVGQVTKVSTLLQNIWKADPATLLPSLQEVFSIISSTGENHSVYNTWGCSLMEQKLASNFILECLIAQQINVNKFGSYSNCDVSQIVIENLHLGCM